MRNSYDCIYNCLFCFKLEILFKIGFFSCVCVGLSTVQRALGCHHSRKGFVQLGGILSTADVQIHLSPCPPPLLYHSCKPDPCEFWNIDSPGVQSMFKMECCVLTFYGSVLIWDLKQCVFQNGNFLYKGNYYCYLLLLTEFTLLLNQECVLFEKLGERAGAFRKEH